MSTEALSQLEEKIQNAIETISLYHMETEELRETKNQAEQELTKLSDLNSKHEEEKKILQQKITTLQEAKSQSELKIEELLSINIKLEQEQKVLQQEHQSWSDKVSALLSKLDTATEEVV